MDWSEYMIVQNTSTLLLLPLQPVSSKESNQVVQPPGK